MVVGSRRSALWSTRDLWKLRSGRKGLGKRNKTKKMTKSHPSNEAEDGGRRRKKEKSEPLLVLLQHPRALCVPAPLPVLQIGQSPEGEARSPLPPDLLYGMKTWEGVRRPLEKAWTSSSCFTPRTPGDLLEAEGTDLRVFNRSEPEDLTRRWYSGG